MELESKERTLCQFLWGAALDFSENAGIPQDPFNLTLIWSSLLYSVHDILEGNHAMQNIEKEYVYAVSKLFNVPSHEVEVLAEFTKFQRRIYRTISIHDLNPATKTGARKILELSLDIRFPDGPPDDVLPTALDTVELSLAAAESVNLCATLFTKNTQPTVSTQQSQPSPSPANNHTSPPKNEYGCLLSVFGICILLILGLFVLFLCLPDSTEPPAKPSTSVTEVVPKKTTIATEPPAKPIPRPGQGHIAKYPKDKRVAPLSIIFDYSSNYDYYFTLKSTTNSKNNMSFYIRTGMDLELLVPLGTYKIYYAYGNDWQGPSNLFGENTVCQVFDETFTFSQDSQSYLGWTISMKPSTNGNLDSDYIDISDFPH